MNRYFWACVAWTVWACNALIGDIKLHDTTGTVLDALGIGSGLAAVALATAEHFMDGRTARIRREMAEQFAPDTPLAEVDENPNGRTVEGDVL